MRRRALATGFLSAFAAVLLAVIAGGIGTQSRTLAAQQPSPPPRLDTPPPYTLPPQFQFTLPPEFTQTPPPVATLPPTPVPTPTPLPTTAPVPTGPAVGTEVTPPALANVQLAQVGPTPQSGGSDVTLVILIVIVGLSLLAIGAFVLAIAVQ